MTDKPLSGLTFLEFLDTGDSIYVVRGGNSFGGKVGQVVSKAVEAAQAEQEAAEAAQEAAEAAQEVAEAAQAAAEAAQFSAEAARDAAFVNADVYEDTTAGLSGTTEGDQFQVVEDDQIVRYLHDTGGVAVQLAVYPSGEAIRLPQGTDYELAITDEEGFVGAGWKDGILYSAGIDGESIRNEDFEVRLVTGDFGFAVVDPDGFVGVPHGLESFSGGTPSHTVYTVFAEVWTDPSRDCCITWRSNSAEADVLEYQEGDGTWVQVKSFRSRPFPLIPSTYLHSALIENRTAGTTVDLRIPGSDWTGKVKIASATDVKLAFLSDYHLTDFGASSYMAKIGAKVSAAEPDVVLLLGDYLPTENGIVDGTNAQVWANFIDGFAKYHTSTDGSLVQLIALVGNHDAAAPDGGAGGAFYGGTGRAGFVHHIFNWGYAAQHPNRFAEGVAWFRIAWDVLFIGLNTDHTLSLSAQRQWFNDILATYGHTAAHVFVGGHVPAFNARRVENYKIDSQARTLRNQFWMALQQYANARAYLGGHTHHLLVTPKLKMDYDQDKSLSENDTRYFTDAAGIRQIGCAPWGGTPGQAEVLGDPITTSSIDASSFIEALLAPDGEGGVVDIGDITNADPELQNGWLIEIDDSEGEITYTALSSLEAGNFYTFTDEV